MAIHSGMPGGTPLCPWGHKESDTTKHIRPTSSTVQLLRACTHVLCAGEGKPSSVSRGALSNKRVCALHSRMNLMQLDNSAEYTK